jgi:hypothetical protein
LGLEHPARLGRVEDVVEAPPGAGDLGPRQSREG